MPELASSQAFSWSMLVLLAATMVAYVGGIAQTIDQGFEYVGRWFPTAVGFTIALAAGELYLLRLAHSGSPADRMPKRVAAWVAVLVPTAAAIWGLLAWMTLTAAD